MRFPDSGPRLHPDLVDPPAELDPERRARNLRKGRRIVKLGDGCLSRAQVGHLQRFIGDWYAPQHNERPQPSMPRVLWLERPDPWRDLPDPVSTLEVST
jgi:hypothetical protein